MSTFLDSLGRIVRQFVQDTRYAIRILTRAKLFTATAVICLALGIGGNTALFSAVRSVLWTPLPWEDAERIVAIEETNPEGRDHSVSLPNFDDWMEQQTAFESLGAVRRLAFNLGGIDRPEHVGGAQVTVGVLQALRVEPAHGRIFTGDDDQPGADPVAIISHALHDNVFDGDPSAVGSSIQLDGKPFTVVGVLPDDYELLGGRQDVLVPLGQWRDTFPGFSQRGTHPNIVVVGRIADGRTLEDARAELSGIAARLAEAYPDTNRGQGVAINPLLEHTVGGARKPLMFLLAAVGLVLLIAAANVAGLLVARAHARAGEFGLRRALGATRGRLVRQLLTESLVLGLLGGAAGILVGAWGLEVILEVLATDEPRVAGAEIDWVVLAFTTVLAGVTAVGFGLLPATAAIRPRTSRRGARVQGLLVVGELALAVVLLAAAMLSFRSLQAMHAVELGFQPQGVLNVRVLLNKEDYPDAASWDRFFGEVTERVGALPGVEAVSHATMTPMWDHTNTARVHAEDHPAADKTEMDMMLHFVVAEGYFDVLGAQLLQGRTFTTDDMQDGHLVVVVDRSMAEAYWPDEDPIGKRISWGSGPDGTWREVIGVVETMQHYELDRGSTFEGFSPMTPKTRQGLAQFGMTMSILVRADGALEPVADAVRETVLDIDPDQPVFAAKPLTDIVAAKRLRHVVLAGLLGTFAALALILSAVGLYGVTSYTVGRRTRELGIRIALGATPRDVVRLIVGQSSRLALVGAGIGIVLAVLVGLAARGLVYGVSTLDPVTYVATAAVLLTVASVAAYLPARRATKIDPTTALRR